MFGDGVGERPPWSSAALELSQAFRQEFGMDHHDAGRPADAGGAVAGGSAGGGGGGMGLGSVMRSPAKLLSGISKRVW